MPSVVKKDGNISGYFINNFNIMYLILIIFGLVFIAVYVVLVVYRVCFKNKQKLESTPN